MNWRSVTDTIPNMIAKGQAGSLVKAGVRRFYSDRHDYLLRCDLAKPVVVPRAKIPVTIRPLRDSDIPRIALELPDRVGVMKSGISTCYLGITEDDQICYMQWLIGPSYNHLRPRAIGLTLSHDERLLEWAYTFQRYRGLSIMACGMGQILQQGRAEGARWVYTIVETNNIPSLKGCRAVGFEPYQKRSEHWRLLWQRQMYRQLSEREQYPVGTW